MSVRERLLWGIPSWWRPLAVICFLLGLFIAPLIVPRQFELSPIQFLTHLGQ